MTTTRLGIKAGFVVFVGLLCTSASFAVQDEKATSDSNQQSSEAKDSSTKKTKRTPFGRSKATSEKKPKSSAPATTPFMQVEEKGDSITFKRRSPFGVQAWTKKRSELTDEEQEMLRAHRSKQTKAEPSRPSAPAAKTAPATR